MFSVYINALVSPCVTSYALKLAEISLSTNVVIYLIAGKTKSFCTFGSLLVLGNWWSRRQGDDVSISNRLFTSILKLLSNVIIQLKSARFNRVLMCDLEFTNILLIQRTENTEICCRM